MRFERSIRAPHHNIEYTAALDENGSYTFNYLCPECNWELSYTLDEEEHIFTYAAVEGVQTFDIEITTES